jgi:CRISPR-associated protein Cmr5
MSNYTLGQRRAAHALNVITELVGKDIGNFDSYVERLPATIVMNGLGQAMASELASARLAKKEKMNPDERSHERIFKEVETWLRESGVYSKEKGLMEAIIEGSQEDYVRAQAEALAYLDWLKKFTQAYLKGD